MGISLCRGFFLFLRFWVPIKKHFNSYYIFCLFWILKRSTSCTFVCLCKLEYFMGKKSRFSLIKNNLPVLNPPFWPTTFYKSPKLLNTAHFYGLPFIPVQLSWQPNIFCPFRVAFVASRRVASRRVASLFSWGLRVASIGSHSSRCFLSDVPIKYVACHSGIGETPWTLFTLQTEPNRTKPNRIGPHE